MSWRDLSQKAICDANDSIMENLMGTNVFFRERLVKHNGVFENTIHTLELEPPPDPPRSHNTGSLQTSLKNYTNGYGDAGTFQY